MKKITYQILGALFMRNKGNGGPEISNHKVFGTMLLAVSTWLVLFSETAVPDMLWYTVWGFLGLGAVKAFRP